MTTFLLIRHGESEANLKRFFAGQCDVALTPLGHQQARCTADFVAANYHVDAVYASDLRRAYDTGIHIASCFGLPVLSEPGLREIFSGQWQGKTFDELQTSYTDSYSCWLTDIGNACCPDGETVAQLAGRVYDTICRIAEENPDKTVAIATHATPIRTLQWRMSGQPLSHMKDIPWVSNASVSELRWENGVLTPVKISQDAHLADMQTRFPPNV